MNDQELFHFETADGRLVTATWQGVDGFVLVRGDFIARETGRYVLLLNGAELAPLIQYNGEAFSDAMGKHISDEEALLRHMSRAVLWRSDGRTASNLSAAQTFPSSSPRTSAALRALILAMSSSIRSSSALRRLTPEARRRVIVRIMATATRAELRALERLIAKHYAASAAQRARMLAFVAGSVLAAASCLH